MTPAAQRAEDKAALRAGILQLADDAIWYRQLSMDFYVLNQQLHDRIAILERQKSDLADELRRVTSRAVGIAPEAQGAGDE